MRKHKRPSRLGDISAMSHAERLAAIMRDLKTPYALATATAVIEQIKSELKDAEEGLSIARQLAGVDEQKAPE